MSEFIVLKTSQKEKWNCIVRKFKFYEVFYLREYVEAFEELSMDVGLLLYYDDGNTMAVTTVFKRDISECKDFSGTIKKGEFFDLITPYGYGGMLIQGDHVDKVWKAYDRFCNKERIISEFVRFNLFSQNNEYYNGEVETRTHNIVRNLQISLEEMMMDFEHKVRKNLKKAQRNQLIPVVDEDGEAFEDFLKIYYATMERNNAEKMYYFPRTFFEKFRKMSENAVWFHIKKDDKIVATELVIYDENNCYSYLGGTLAEYFEYRPNELLKFEIMKWAKEKGLKNFVLGGGYGQDDGIFKYKQSFAPNGKVSFYIGKRVFIPDIYKRLIDIRSKNGKFDENTNFFPKYRG